MKVYEGINEFTRLDYAIVTSGTFDGVHKGHQKILQRIGELAKKNNGETVLITYWPHPRFILCPDDERLKLLSTLEEKIALLSEWGIDHLLKIPFTEAFSQLSSEDFIRKVLVDAIGTSKLVIGYDHRFGKNRSGNFKQLVERSSYYGYKVEEISKQEVDDIAVSSTKIRNALKKGDVTTANDFLGRSYSMKGKVMKGKQVGRKIGFPTANLAIKERYKLIPKDGVYAVNIKLGDNCYQGMLNIGKRPTVNGTTRTIETHIFGFDKNIYGEDLCVQFIRFMREEIAFENLDALKKQLVQDKELAIKILNY